MGCLSSPRWCAFMVPQEYLTELFYPSRFYDFMSPVLLNYLAALHGFSPRPLTPGFTYCELGCGGGATTHLLAAANPQGQFIGIDINPEHIAYAQTEAAAAHLENLRFIEQDLAALEESSFPDCDFITIHGLYSWVSPATREALVAILGRKLKPGGLVMLSYNAMPGSAMIAPLRDMMLAYTHSMVANSALEKVHEGIKYLRFLCDNQAGFFAENPLAKSALTNYLARDDHYLAHEFFNQYWTPFYFMEVAEQVSRAGLSFVGTLPLSSNYLEASIPSPFHAFFKTAPDRITLERHKAFVRNDRFRRDVYIKSDSWVVPEAERVALFSAFYFGTEYDQVSPQIRLHNGRETLELDYSDEPRHSLGDALASRPQTLDELHACPALQAYSRAELLDGIHSLILGGEFRAFAQAPLPLPTAEDLSGCLCIPVPLNARLLAACHHSDEAGLYLASPVVGDGVLLSQLEALLLDALTQVPVAEVPGQVLARLHHAGKNLTVRGETIAEMPAQLELLQLELETLLNGRLGRLIELGVLGLR